MVRRARAFAGAVAVEVAIGAAALAVTQVAGPAAAAAPSGQVTVGSTAVVLNQPADPFLGKITPSADAAVTGMYAPQVAWPLIGLHMVLLPNGHVVSYGSPVGVARQGGLAYDDWNPAMGTAAAAHTPCPTRAHARERPSSPRRDTSSLHTAPHAAGDLPRC